MKNISGGRIVSGAFWNLFGQVTPVFSAIIAIPILVGEIGIERFGVLTVAWILIGYFSLFDFGVGRALTKLVAERIGGEREIEIPTLFWTSFVLMAGLSIVASAGIAFGRHLMIGKLGISSSLTYEVNIAFILLAGSMPFVILTTGFRGVLEAYQEFKLVNIIRMLFGVFTYVGPLMVLPFSNQLHFVVASLVVGRALATWAYYTACKTRTPVSSVVEFDRKHIAPLIRFGGWMTVVNIIGPLITYVDRFLIGAILSATAVAYYSTPFEMISKVQMLPAAIVTALFPVFAMLINRNSEDAIRIYYRSMIYILGALVPVAALFVFMGPEILQLWLGASFVEHSLVPLQILAVAQVSNGIARVPFAFAQGAGNPKVIAYVNILELVAFVPLIFVLAKYYGINGVAVACLLRSIIDFILLHLVVRKGFANDYSNGNWILVSGSIFPLVLLIGMLINGLAWRILLFSVFLVLLSYFYLMYVLVESERSEIKRRVLSIVRK